MKFTPDRPRHKVITTINSYRKSFFDNLRRAHLRHLRRMAISIQKSGSAESFYSQNIPMPSYNTKPLPSHLGIFRLSGSRSNRSRGSSRRWCSGILRSCLAWSCNRSRWIRGSRAGAGSTRTLRKKNK